MKDIVEGGGDAAIKAARWNVVLLASPDGALSPILRRERRHLSLGCAWPSPSRATLIRLARMKIAQVAPLYEAVPPRLYGGTERVAAHLTDALVHLGHEVTLFASAEAETRATLVPVRDQAIRLDPAPLKSDLAAHLAMLAEVRRRAGIEPRLAGNTAPKRRTG